VLSRSISDVLEHLAAWGEGLGLTRAAVASLSIEDLEAQGFPKGAEKLNRLVQEAEAYHRTACATRLPALMAKTEDIYVAAVQRSLPNLFGRGVIRGGVHEISACDDWSMRIEGKIACIESADPGFDWVFGTGAAALVTKYGGANSHMAIRCIEIGFPAAIGCGEQLYARILEAGSAEINFSNGSVKPLYGY
ncbi:MAG: PEP-utilizing enzyme, partial [Saprospiraceae bacterium]